MLNLLLGISPSSGICCLIGRRRAEQKLKDLLAERLLVMHSLLLPGDLIVGEVIHVIRLQLEGELIQVIGHVRNVAEEVARNQLLLTHLQLIGRVLYGDGMVAYLSVLFLHSQVKGVKRMKRIRVAILDFLFFNLVLAHGINECICLFGCFAIFFYWHRKRGPAQHVRAILPTLCETKMLVEGIGACRRVQEASHFRHDT